MNNSLAEIINNTKSDVQTICKKYGVYGNVVCLNSYAANDNESKLYIIAGTDPEIEKEPIPSYIKPDEIIRRNNRTEGLFYTNLWVWDMSEGNRMQAFEELMDYCNKIETLKGVYTEFKTPLPEKIWDHEINGLIHYYEEYLKGLFNNYSPAEYAKNKLEKFFKKENNTNKEWLNFYRSDRYPSNKNILTTLRSYMNRKSNVVDLDILMENSNEVQNVEMNEFEYKIFAKKMQDLYPDVTFAVSDVTVIDHGSAGTVDNSTEPPTKYVTQEEFAVVMKNRFAEEGWSCISNLNPCYWEIRKVYYNTVDEPIIARVYNAIAYQYTNSLEKLTIDYDGDVSLHKISTNNFMNFISEAKAHNLRYYIDFKGAYGETSLDFINVITRKSSDSIVNKVINNTLTFKADNDHKLSMITPSLSEQIENVSKEKIEAHFKKNSHRTAQKEYENETENKTYL